MTEDPDPEYEPPEFSDYRDEPKDRETRSREAWRRCDFGNPEFMNRV